MKPYYLRALATTAFAAGMAFLPVTAQAAVANEIGFAVTSASVAESGASLAISVNRTGGVGAVSVNYATTNGSALSGFDYASTSGTLNWADGDTSAKTFNVPIIADSQLEGDQGFTVELSAPSGGATLAPSASSMVITINDGPSIRFVGANYLTPESLRSNSLTVRRVGSASGAVGVSFTISPGTATAGSDFRRNPLTGTVSWANGDNADKTISFDILEDTVRENPDETFTVVLSNPTGSASLLGSANTMVVSIIDNDGGAPASSSNSGGGTYTFGDTITLTATFTGGTSQLGGDPVYTWKRGDVTIINGGRYQQSVSIPADSNVSVATLVITDAKSVDAGTYSFTMSNVNGTFTEILPEVTVNSATTSRDPATTSLTASQVPTAFLTLPNGNTLMAVSGNATGASSTGANGFNLVVVQLNGRVAATGAGVFDNKIEALHLLDDGKVLVLGSFTQIGGVGGAGRSYLARLNADLTVDSSFVPSPAPVVLLANEVRDRIATDHAGRIYIGGDFDNYGGVSGYNNLVRLYPDGTLDRSFVRAPDGRVRALLRQSDGKIVVAGEFNLLLGDALELDGIYRLDMDGIVDVTFAPPISTEAVRYSAATLDSEGRIVLAQTEPKNTVQRFLSTGVEDSSFTFNNTFNQDIKAILAVEGDKILVAGGFLNAQTTVGPVVTTTFARILRLDEGGGYDTAYNSVLEPSLTSSALNGDVESAYLAPTGRVWLGGGFTTSWLGSSTRVLVLQGDASGINFVSTPTGEVYTDGDTLQFSASITGRNGVTYQWKKNEVALANGGRVSGATSANLTISNADSSDNARYSVTISNGIDTQTSPSISAERIGTPVIISSTTAQTKDVGSTATFTADVTGSGALTYAWLRNGVQLVNGADTGGATISGANTATLTIAGLTASQAGFYTLRVTASGVDPVLSEPALLTVARRPGALASTVADVLLPSISANGDVYAILRLQDGSMLIGGNFTSITVGGVSHTRTRIARISEAGVIDASFNPTFSGAVRALAQDALGNVFVGGDFGSVNFGSGAVARIRVARLTSTLTLDGSFNTSAAGPADNNVYALAPLGDGSVYVGGSFTTVTGATVGTAARIALLDANGARATSFNSGATDEVRAIVRLSDGSLIVGGLSTSWTTSAAANLVKLAANGTRDAGFVSPANGTNVRSLRVLSDGSLLVGGASGYLKRVNTANGAEVTPSLNVLGHSGSVTALAQAADGKILSGSAGEFRRVTLASVVDSGFDDFNNQISALAVDASGRIWVGGSFNTYASQSAIGLAVLAGGNGVSSVGALSAQTITFPAIPGRVFSSGASPINLAATASSGLSVSYTVSGPASISGNQLTILGAGNISVTASQVGNGTTAPASLTRSFTVSKAAQSITFAPLADRLSSAPAFALSATASSGLSVSYAISPGSPASLSTEGGVTTVILDNTILTEQTVTITATQVGNEDFAPAAPKSVSFQVRVTGSTAQTINFPQPLARTYRVTPAATLNATASSGLPVTFVVVSGPGVIGSDGKTLSTTGAGSIVVRAVQAGNQVFAPVTSAPRTIVVNKAPQAITFNVPTTISLSTATTENLSATASSSLPVAFSLVGTTNPASLVGNVLTFTGAGKVTVVARQAGDNDFNAAPAITRVITVTAPVLTLSNLNQIYDGTRRSVTVSGVPSGVTATVSYGSSTYPTSELAPIDAGTYTVIARLSGGGATTTKKLVIAKRPLRIVPEDQIKRVGIDLAAESYPLTFGPVDGNPNSGFVTGEDRTFLDTQPTARPTAGRTSPAGDYFIIPSGAADTNYSFVYARGKLTLVGVGGSYQALLLSTDTSPKPIGLLTLTMLNNSFGYTGSLILADEAGTVTLRSGAVGTLNEPLAAANVEASVQASGEFTREAVAGTSTRPRLPKLELSLTVNSSGVLTGSVESDDVPYAVLSNGRSLRMTKSNVGVGSYTMIMTPPSVLDGDDEPASGSLPEGFGHATGSISTAGLLRLSGRLPDGTVLTAALQADTAGHYRMFLKPYTTAINRNGSYLGGFLETVAHPTVPALLRVPAARLLWNKVGISTEATYKAGFGPVQTDIAIEAWQSPTPTVRLPMLLDIAEAATQNGDFELNFEHSLLTTAQTELLDSVETRTMVPAGSILAVPADQNPSVFALTVTPTTGAIAGSMRLPLAPTSTVRTVRFTGVLIQRPESNATIIGGGQFQMPVADPSVGASSTATISVFGGMTLTKPETVVPQ
jgi:uncharacterized delta-60 repeat protein